MGIEVPRQRHVPLVQIYGDSVEPEDAPADERPWLDDRAAATFPIVLGLVPHDDVRLGFRRIALPPDVPVRIVSRNPTLVQVAEPSGGHIASGDAEIRLTTGDPGSADTDVQIAVQCAGKMIHSIEARVFELLRVPVNPVLVQVTPDGEPLIGARAELPDLAALEQGVNHYFRRIGVQLVFGPLQHAAVEGYQGRFRLMGDSYPELDAAIRQCQHPHQLNLYFTTTFVTPGRDGHYTEDRSVLGYNVTQASQPCVAVRVERSPNGRFLSTIAHEIGHYFGLRHPIENGVHAPPASGWFLMHRSSPGGRLIPLKWVTAHGPHRLQESQASTMRDTIRGRPWSL